MVVDDETEITELVCEMLKHAGIACQAINDSSLAVDAILGGDYTAVLSDISMPKLNGIELMTKVCSSGNGVLFVFLTAHVDITLVKEALQLRAIDFIQKPFMEKEIIEVVSRSVEIGYRLRKIKNTGNCGHIDRDLKFVEKKIIALLAAGQLHFEARLL